MAQFNIQVNAINFFVEQTSLIDSECSTIVEYTVTANTNDAITITLTGSYSNESYTSNGVTNFFNDTVMVVFNNSLTISFAVENGGSAGIFKQGFLEVNNTTIPSVYTDNVLRQNDSPVCVNVNAATYDDLNDTPNTKIGSEGKFIRVNDAGTAHEYVEVKGVDKHFEFDQPTAQSSWAITHNLQKFPSVTVLNTSGDEVVGCVNHIDDNTILIIFSAPFAGKAYLN